MSGALTLIKRVHLMGFDFVSNDFDEIIDEIDTLRYQASNFHSFLITPNADQVLQFNQDRELKQFYQKSYFILPDGFPIILYSKLIRKPLLKKLSGSDFFPKIWEVIKRKQKDTLVVCPNEQVGRLLKTEYPLLRYHTPGYLDIHDTVSFVNEANLIMSEINNQFPEYIIIGLGFPKQEILSKLICERIHGQPMPLFMLLGASFEFYLKIKKRAPVWVQKLGFEWFHRLIQEPARLWKRYTIGNVKFIFFFIKELMIDLQKN